MLGQSVLVGADDCLGAVAGVDLGEEVVDVALDGAFGDDESLGDLAVGKTGGDEGEHFGFSGGEPIGERRKRWLALSG